MKITKLYFVQLRNGALLCTTEGYIYKNGVSTPVSGNDDDLPGNINIDGHNRRASDVRWKFDDVILSWEEEREERV